MNKRIKLPFRIGCDPEVSLLMGKKFVNAGTAQALSRYSFEDSKGSIGMDCGMAELRPEPTYDIIELAQNIKHILKKASEKAGFMNWDASANLCSSGGHIHLELPESLVRDADEDCDGYHKSGKIYDYARKMFSFYLPIWLCDDANKTNKARKNSGYGHYGDYRVEKKSRGYTFELRTPSGQWLICPKTALATFAYLATVHNEIINHPESFKNCEDIICKNQDEYKTIEDVAKSRYEPFLDPLFKKIKRAVKTFEFYPKFKAEINWLLNSKKVQEEKEKYNWDVLKGWGLEPKEQSLAQLSSKKSIETRMKRFDHSLYSSNWQNIVPFVFNDDFNIATWTHQLTKQVMAFNWKLQRNYIFYGLKKEGSKEPIVSDAKYRVHMGQSALNTLEKQAEAKRAIARMVHKYKPNGTTYLVGLPYAMRKADDFKFLIELVHAMEHQLPADALETSKSYANTLLDLNPVQAATRPAKSEAQKYKDYSTSTNEALMAGLKPSF